MKRKSRLRRLAWLTRFALWRACQRGGSFARHAWLYVCTTIFSVVASVAAHLFFDTPGLPSVKSALVAFFCALIPGLLVATRHQRINLALDAFAASSQSRAQISLAQAQALAERDELDQSLGATARSKARQPPRL